MTGVPPPPLPPGPPPSGPPPFAGGPAGPSYGYVAPQNNGNAIAALCCAIGAWMVCPIVLAIIALVLAANAEREIALSRGAQAGEGLVQAARIVSWIHLCLMSLIVVGVILVVAASGA